MISVQTWDALDDDYDRGRRRGSGGRACRLGKRSGHEERARGSPNVRESVEIVWNAVYRVMMHLDWSKCE